jgi:acyl transferase domain-containing protein
MRDADHFYLKRSDQQQLLDDLHKVPELALELQIAITNQSRIGGGRFGKKTKQKLAELWPYQPEAAEIADELHDTLEKWARVVCDRRQLPYVPRGYHYPRGFIGPTREHEKRTPIGYTETTPGYARWLDRHVVDLSMLDNAIEARDDILAVIKAANRTVCPPYAPIEINTQRVKDARLQTLNAHGISVAAGELGEEYRNLTERRVQVLRDAGKIRPVAHSLSKSWRPTWPAQYRLGDVLDAHLLHPIRRRHTRGETA